MIRPAIFSVALAATIMNLACTNGPKTVNSANAQQANKSEQSANASPLVQPTLNGDIERIYLYIATAREYAKNSKWQDAEGQLRAAHKELDAALARKPRLAEEFEALKGAIDRTIGTLQRQDRDADSQLAELQVRINAIKVNTP